MAPLPTTEKPYPRRRKRPSQMKQRPGEIIG
jgi:hypothetical protein